MRCLVCGKDIGPIRRLFDRRYCCDHHRKTARRLSARAIRDTQDPDELEEPWLITPGLGKQKRKSSGTGLGAPATILLVALAVALVVTNPQRQGRASFSTPKPRRVALLERLQQYIPGAPTFDLREDFRRGAADWIGRAGGQAAGWSRRMGKIQLGRLRLWKPTLQLANYQMVFQGQIESKAIGWAFRASDLDNYYATKLTIAGRGGAQRSEIIRYVVVDGRKLDRVELPLPIMLQEDTPYKVRVTVKDKRFSTLIDGQVVDTWSDARHPRGGIGFFSDPGEQALVSWVRVNDSEGLFERLLSLSLLVGPPQLLRPAGK